MVAKKLSLPRTIWIGTDALANAVKDICVLGEKALIVCGKSMIRQGHMKTLTDILNAKGITWSGFSDISGEPTDEMIAKGTKQYLQDRCDFIIGFGGGSPLDAAKAIALRLEHEYHIIAPDYPGFGQSDSLSRSRLLRHRIGSCAVYPECGRVGCELEQHWHRQTK